MNNVICLKCKQAKSPNEFYKATRRKNGLTQWCKDCSSQYHAEYHQTHKERLKQYRRDWAINNPDKMRAYWTKPDAKAKQKQRKREWDRKRAADPVFRLGNNIRGNMYHALKAKKGFRKWETLIGYTLEDLIKHLTPQFSDGMTWENYGNVWHVDHITPKSWFKYDSTEHPAFKECWALKNLQPKLKVENIRKGNRFAG